MSRLHLLHGLFQDGSLEEPHPCLAADLRPELGERVGGGRIRHAGPVGLALADKKTTLSGIDAQEKNPQNLKPIDVPDRVDIYVIFGWPLGGQS
jgi:hypothetical protein